MANDDLSLLREYARSQSEPAFSELVARHVNLVYSVALRQVQNPHVAEEITQAVFIILSRKAGGLGDKVILPGWLCRTARFVSNRALREQSRRRHREEESHMQSLANEPAADKTWEDIAPLLDTAMHGLGQKDHDALVLRFFEKKNFVEVGAALGASESAAKMRVNRALEKLRKFFARRGIASTTATLAGVISTHSVRAAPVELAKTANAVVFAKEATASTSTLSLIKGALKIMAWTKAKTAVVIGAAILLTTGATTTLVAQHLKSITDFPRSSWEFAGYADPKSALESAMWAWGKGDVKAFIDTLTPDAQQREKDHLDQMQPADLIQEFRGITGYHVLELKTVADNQVALRFRVDFSTRVIHDPEKTVYLKKSGNEWKLDAIP